MVAADCVIIEKRNRLPGRQFKYSVQEPGLGTVLTLDGYLDHTVHLIFKECVCFFDPV